MSKGAVLESTPSAGKLSIAGQNVLDPERSSIVQRGIYQRVQEADGRNWLYYQLFLRQDFDACNISLATCEEPNSPVQGTYGIFMKGLIASRQGKLLEALGYMNTCHSRDPRNLEVLKELISLNFVTGNHNQALVYVQLVKAMQPSEDWFLEHYQGLCYEKMDNIELVRTDDSAGLGCQISGKWTGSGAWVGRRILSGAMFHLLVHFTATGAVETTSTKAEEHLKSAITIQPQEKPYLVLAEFYVRHGMGEKALETLERAKRIFPDSPVVAARLGTQQIQSSKDMDKGFGNLAQAASMSKGRNDATLLAVGSVMQRKLDPDGALKKYEALIQDSGDINAAILNNIGLCYFAKRRGAPGKRDIKASEDEYSARILQAVSCLKKAQQMAPFDARILRNLGYVTRELRLFATASFQLMSSIRLGGKSAGLPTYMLLAGVADNLEIGNQANQLYKYCLKNNSARDPWVYLNYATFILRQGDHNRAVEMAQQCQTAVAEWEQTGQPVDQQILDRLKQLRGRIQLPETATPSQPPATPPALSSVSASNVSHGMVVSAQVEPLSPK